MPTCLLCKKDVTSGYVVCGGCAEHMKPRTMQPVLYGFAAWLGAKLAQDHSDAPCPVCEFAASGACLDLAKCRQGIASWFQAKADQFLGTCGYDGILGRLKTVCPFPKVFEDVDDADAYGPGEPRKKICHIRANHDDYRWWNTFWGCHCDLATPKMANEIDQTYEALTAKDALHDLIALRRFCWSHPEAQAGPEADEEFNFYLEGKTCDFWVRLITRDKDHNMYLNAYAKAESGRGAN